MEQTNTEVLTDNFNLQFLTHLSICCCKLQYQSLEQGHLSESPADHFQSIYKIPKDIGFGEGMRKWTENSPHGSKCLVSITPAENPYCLSIVSQYMRFDSQMCFP